MNTQKIIVKEEFNYKYIAIQNRIDKTYTSVTESKKYEFKKILANYRQKLDYDEDLFDDLVIQYSNYEALNHVKVIIGPSLHESDIANSISDKDWDKVLSIVKETIVQLEYQYLNLVKINELIMITDTEFGGRYDVRYEDIITTINKHFREIKINYEIGKKIKALDKAKELEEYIQLISELENTLKSLDAPPIYSTEVEPITDKDGTIYRFKF